MTDPVGHTRWTFAGGNIPVESTGPEPEFTSRDDLCVLNAGDEQAALTITVYFRDDEPVGPFHLDVAAERVRHVPINNLIDPQAIPLGEPYALVVHSDRPVVAQLTRTDTRRGGLAIATASGHPSD